MEKVSWIAVGALALASVAIVGTFVTWFAVPEGSALLGGALVLAVLSLRDR